MSPPRAPSPVIIRGPVWLSLRVATVLGIVILGLAGWGLYALGRAGISAGAPGLILDPGTLRQMLRERDATIAELRRQQADYETSQTALEQERREVSQTIGELQAEAARLRQQLEFYRGIVAADDPRAPVSIRSARITRGDPTRPPTLRISLAQPGNPQSVIIGTVAVTVEGRRGSTVEQFALPVQRYSFRFFENLEQNIELPTGFVPQRVSIEVRPSGRQVRPVVQSLLWPVGPAAEGE